MASAKLNYLNTDEPETAMDHAPRDAVRREFGKRLQQSMTAKGWNQSELARRAAAHMPDGKLGRDNVSSYVRGLSLPGPIILEALCRALGCVPTDLLPSRGVPSTSVSMPPLDVKDTGEGKAWLRVNQAVEWDAAIKIMAILRGQEGGQESA